MLSEQVQYVSEEMINLVGEGDAEGQDAHGNDESPDILTLFRGIHLLRYVLGVGLLFFIGSVGVRHGQPQLNWVKRDFSKYQDFFPRKPKIYRLKL